jgi:SAM-dependent methyltransferase
VPVPAIRRPALRAPDHGARSSDEELRHNRQLDHKIVADAAALGFPFQDGSADLVVSRAVVEHIRDNAVFFRNCARVLRPGGIVVHAFSGRFAPFALMNQLLPNRLTRRLVDYLHPEWHEEGNYGFLAFYDRCYFSAIKDLLDRNGFTNTRFNFYIIRAFTLISSILSLC